MDRWRIRPPRPGAATGGAGHASPAAHLSGKNVYRSISGDYGPWGARIVARFLMGFGEGRPRLAAGVDIKGGVLAQPKSKFQMKLSGSKFESQNWFLC